MTLTANERKVNERTTVRITGTITDEAGDPIPAASLTTLTLTVYSIATGAIINSVNNVNILNANRGTVTSGGLLTLTLLPDDGQIVDNTPIGQRESHGVLVQGTYDSGAKAFNTLTTLSVLSMIHVPTEA